MSGGGGLRVVRGLGSETQSRSEKVKPKQPMKMSSRSTCGNRTKRSVGLLAMSPVHQVDEQLDMRFYPRFN